MYDQALENIPRKAFFVSVPGLGKGVEQGEITMAEQDLIHELFQHRNERIQETGEMGRSGKGGRSPKERLQDPVLSAVAEKVRRTLNEVPEVRWDRGKNIKRQLREGTFAPDPSSIAEKVLQETILSEML